jgi:hypothetical protein
VTNDDFQWGKKASESVGEYSPTGMYYRRFTEPETTVRFLLEPNDMITFHEHFDEQIKKSYPCTYLKNCPGCTSRNAKTAKATWKAGTFLSLPGQEHLSLPFKMGWTIWEKLRDVEKWNGTILDRDTVVLRKGAGQQTSYDTEPGEKYPVDVPVLIEDAVNRIGRLSEILREDFVKVWGDDPRNPVFQVDGDEEPMQESEGEPPF